MAAGFASAEPCQPLWALAKATANRVFMQLHYELYFQTSTPALLGCCFDASRGLETIHRAGRIVLHSIPLLAATCLTGFTVLQLLFHTFQ